MGKLTIILWIALAAALVLFFSLRTPSVISPGRGISQVLAQDRAASISALRYELSFHIPEKKADAITGSAVIRFALAKARDVVLDFDQPRDHVRGIRANDRGVEAQFADGHILLPASAMQAGENSIAVDFIAGDESLNRSDDFLYTLFVPARAHLAFPCFDQPDLKARYTLSLAVPEGWQALANGAQATPTTFAETQPLPTYLFAFTAGKFMIETAERNGRTFRMFHRETDAAKVARNRDALFDLHARALAWLEDYTGIPYPWGKFDFALIPSFQFGGMEHAGAILYNAGNMMLDESATQNQMLDRASTISHETAHMWFGDLVTMRWFNDVWMKEVLANFMAAKIVNPSFPKVNHDLRFLLSYHPVAYEVDRTPGANPIRQDLANLDEAGTLYGPIIYQKAPVLMRQLEALAGEEKFRTALREYLKRYSFGNATWLDLVNILGSTEWSKAWIEQRGRPDITTKVSVGPDGKIAALTFAQNGLWPQRLRYALGYADGHLDFHEVDLSGEQTEATQARGLPAPLFVLPNAAGLGYGLFRLDEQTRRYLLDHLEDIGDPLARGSAWVDLWENFLEGGIAPEDYLALITRALPKETNEQNTQRALSNLSRIFWRFLPQDKRLARAAEQERFLREGISRGKSTSEKSAWFASFRNTALTNESLVYIERLWRRDEKIPGLTFSEDDEIRMAMDLAVRGVPVLQAQLDRTVNPDRRARLQFVMPALSPDPAVRQQSFERFRAVENRRREPWVLEALSYLNHPLREDDALRYVAPSLGLLREIQSTGDIFFPKRWMDAALNGHRSPEAAALVRAYLDQNPELPLRLRWIVLTSSDELSRAVR